MSDHKKYFSVALPSAVLLPATASVAGAPATFTPEQEAKISKTAAGYLVAHPEVLPQVSQKLQRIQAEQQTNATTQAILKDAAVLTQNKNTPTYGPASGKVTTIESLNYQYVYYNRLAPAMEQVIKAYPQTRFAFRERPIFDGRWESSLEVVKTGLQTCQQKGADAYLAYHNGIYVTGHNEGKLTTADIRQQMKKAGFDAEKATDIELILQSVNDLAQEVGLSGTPGVIAISTTGAMKASITAFPGLANQASLEVVIKKTGGRFPASQPMQAVNGGLALMRARSLPTMVVTRGFLNQ